MEEKLSGSTPRHTRAKVSGVIALTGVLLLASALPVLASGFGLDTGFNTDGYAESDFDHAIFVDVAVDGEGRTVVVGRKQNEGSLYGLIARYLPNGTLDPGFDEYGYVDYQNLAEDTRITDVVITDGGKIVVTGEVDLASSRDVFVAKFNSDGSPDTSCNGAGEFSDDISSWWGDGSLNETVTGLGVDSAGNILVSGLVSGGTEDIVFVLRLDDECNQDMSFNDSSTPYTPGVFHIEASEGSPGALFDGELAVNDIAVDSADNIIAVGGGKLTGGGPQVAMLFKLGPDGALETSFGTGGLSFHDWSGGPDTIEALVIDSSGNLATTGGRNGMTMVVARFLPNGSPDTSFAGDGGNLFSDAVTGLSISLDSDGGYWAVGTSIDMTDMSISGNLVHFLGTGDLDDSVGDSGVFKPLDVLSNNSLEAVIYDAATDDVVVAGGWNTTMMGDSKAVVARLDSADDGDPTGPDKARRSPKRSYTLDPNGGTCLGKTAPWTTTKRGSLDLPTKADCQRQGFELAGWTKDTALTSLDQLLRTVVARSGRLTAVWLETLDDLTGTTPGSRVGGQNRRTREGGAVIDGYYIPPGIFS